MPQYSPFQSYWQVAPKPQGQNVFGGMAQKTPVAAPRQSFANPRQPVRVQQPQPQRIQQAPMQSPPPQRMADNDGNDALRRQLVTQRDAASPVRNLLTAAPAQPFVPQDQELRAYRQQTMKQMTPQQQQVYAQAERLGGDIDPLAVAMGGPDALRQAQMIARQPYQYQGPQNESSYGRQYALMPPSPSMQNMDFGPSIQAYSAPNAQPMYDNNSIIAALMRVLGGR